MWRLWKGIYPECGGIYAEIDSVRGLCAYDVIYDMRIPCICVDVQGSVRIRESAAVFPGGSRRADHACAVPVGCSGENTGLYAVQLCEGDESGRYRLESRGNIPGSGRCVWRGDDSGNVVDIQEERSSIENYDRIYICSTVHLC